MDTRSYLGQIRRYDLRIKNGLNEIARYRELSTNITMVADNDRVMASPDPDRIGRVVGMIVDLEREIEELVQKYIESRNIIVRQVEQIEKADYYNILFQRYIECKDLSDIADEINYSYDHTKKLHRRAIEEFERKFGMEYKKKAPKDLKDPITTH